jgi:hypothetical protein
MLPNGLPQPPLAVLELPRMREAEAIRQMHEISPIHDRLLEASAGHREFLLGDAQVGEELLGETLGELAIEPLHQRHPFFPRDVVGPDLLRGIVGRAADLASMTGTCRQMLKLGHRARPRRGQPDAQFFKWSAIYPEFLAELFI